MVVEYVRKKLIHVYSNRNFEERKESQNIQIQKQSILSTIYLKKKNTKNNNMGKSIRSKQKRKWRRIKRDKIYKPLAEERLMAALSTLNTAVIVQNGGSGSIGKLKDLLSGRKNSNAKTSNPDGLKALHKFNDRMKKATERKETSKKDHFSFLNKEEIPEWQTTNAKLEAKLLASKINKKKKKMSNQMEVEQSRGRGRRR